MQKKLMRSDNRMIAGVVAGIAEYLDHDIALWRLGTVVALIFTGFFPVGLLYIIAIFVMPTTTTEPAVDYEVHE